MGEAAKGNSAIKHLSRNVINKKRVTFLNENIPELLGKKGTLD